jgi:hypothetical protein
MDFQGFKDKINAISLPPELLGEAMVLYAGLPPEEQSFEARTQRVVALVAAKGLANHGMIAMAVTVRLMALDGALEDAGIRRWTLPGDQPSRSYVHACVLHAAAVEPVLEGPRGQPVFDLERFRTRVLQLTAASGAS